MDSLTIKTQQLTSPNKNNSFLDYQSIKNNNNNNNNNSNNNDNNSSMSPWLGRNIRKNKKNNFENNSFDLKKEIFKFTKEGCYYYYYYYFIIRIVTINT